VANEPTKLFWDSCVFDAYLYDQRSYDLASIEQFLTEAKQKPPAFIIYTSTFVFVEVANSKIRKPDIGSMEDFVRDFVGQIVVIDASPNVNILAGKLRDIPYRHATATGSHVLDAGDAVMLATALFLKDGYGVTIDEFHTFDNATRRGKIPLLSYQDWCVGLTGDHELLAKRVCALKRRPPQHPTPPLPMQSPP
jgi:hypothetical protein